MRIVCGENRISMAFKDVCVGAVFYFEGDYYMKFRDESGVEFNCVNLSTGQLHIVSENDGVYVKYAELHIRG